MQEYQALFEPAEKWNPKDRGFVVTVPDVPEVVTQGETEAEAMMMAADALALILEEYIRQGKPLPPARKHRGSKYRVVRFPAVQAAKITLYETFLASALRKAELARRMGIPRTNVDRLFDLRRTAGFPQVEQALHVLGKQLRVTVEDAA